MTTTRKIMVATLLYLTSVSAYGSTLSELVHKYKDVNLHIERGLENLENPHKQGLIAIYKDREYRSIWVHDKDRYIPLLQRLYNADSHGLKPAEYQVAKLAEMLSKSSGEDLAKLDIQFSISFIAYANDMVNGRFEPTKIGDQWFIEQPNYKPLRDLYKIANNSDGDSTQRYLSLLEPPFKAYQALRDQLAYYQALVLNGGWPSLTGTALLKEGDTDPEIAVLRKRLALAQVIVDNSQKNQQNESSLMEYLINLGSSEDGKTFLGIDIQSALQAFQKDKDSQSSNEESNADTANPSKKKPNYFDAELATQLKTYQKQHGLEPDGLLGATSREMLNIDAGARYRQILLNLERFRWLPRKLPDDYIWVDVAAYNMSAIFDKKTAMTSAVIVGKEGRETPAFQDEIQYLEFNPYWNIPAGILYKDIIPKVKKDPSYLSTKQIKVYEDWSKNAKEIDPKTIDWSKYSASSGNRFEYRLRQEPGPKNSLGLIKFIFPNEYSIYLHDTPHRELFDKSQRYFSSGCIRVQNYQALASLLLNKKYKADNSNALDENPFPSVWTEQLVDKRLEENRNQKVYLDQSVPVFIVYFTAWVDKEGQMQFRDDIYNRDAKMQEILKDMSLGL